MGTSKSASGPGDRRPLLPSWALEPLDPPTIAPLPVESPSTAPVAPPIMPDSPTLVPPSSLASQAAATLPWKSARMQMGRVATGGGRAAMGSAARRYVRAQGGARRAASAARVGRSSTARLGSFLSTAATRGFAEAAKEFGLAKVVGSDPESVIAAVCDAVAPDGATREEAAARSAVFEALMPLYEQILEAARSPDATGVFTADDVRTAIEVSIVAFIYHRWLQDVGRQLERKGTTGAAAARIERDVKHYAKEVVSLDLQDIDVLRFDWTSREGRQFVQTKYEEVYRVFEET